MTILHGWINGVYDIKHAEHIFNNLKKNYAVDYNIMGMNGENTCNFFSCRNHLGKGLSKLIDELELMAKNNLETYGIIYFNDDEDKEFYDTWQVWLIRKGVIEKTKDTYLSPISEKVENY